MVQNLAKRPLFLPVGFLCTVLVTTVHLGQFDLIDIDSRGIIHSVLLLLNIVQSRSVHVVIHNEHCSRGDT